MKIWFVLGYLGSGKTTFVKNFLANNKGRNAVLVNDFGDFDVDGKILSRYATVKSIFGGSIFCSCKSDKFVETMIELTKMPLDNIIVETSGLANPYALLSLMDIIKSNSLVNIELAPIFCLVDSSTLEKVLPIVRMIKIQIVASDVVIINKIDLVKTIDKQRITSLIKTINANVAIITTQNSLLSDYSYPIIPKITLSNIMDIVTEKCSVIVKDITLDKLEGICEKLSAVSHRIKGVVSINGKKCIYEYINGSSKTTEYFEDGECILVLLSCGGALVKNVKLILENNNYMFLKQEER